jgi:hypothetical protein
MKNNNADQINEIIAKVGGYKSFQILPDFKQKAIQKRIQKHLDFCKNETRISFNFDPLVVRRVVEESAREQKTWVGLQNLKREKAATAKQPKRGKRFGLFHFGMFAAVAFFLMQIFS